MPVSRPALLCAAAVATVSLTASFAQARPQYMAQFKTAYPALEEQIATTRCFTCHGPTKKDRNAYGEAVMKGIAEPNVKEEAVIQAALKAAEAMPSDVEGKTFGELIAAKKMPAGT